MARSGSAEGRLAALRLGQAVGPAPPSAGRQAISFQWALLYFCLCPAVREESVREGRKSKKHCLRSLSKHGEKVRPVSVGDSGLPWPQASRFLWSVGPGVAELLLWMAVLAVRRAHPRAKLKPHLLSNCSMFLDMSVF